MTENIESNDSNGSAVEVVVHSLYLTNVYQNVRILETRLSLYVEPIVSLLPALRRVKSSAAPMLWLCCLCPNATPKRARLTSEPNRILLASMTLWERLHSNTSLTQKLHIPECYQMHYLLAFRMSLWLRTQPSKWKTSLKTYL